MSSRRIGSFVNLCPIQDLSINPFSELDSDSINQLTRSVSNGQDGVIFGLDVKNTNWDMKPIVSYDIINDGNLHKFEDICRITTKTISYNLDLHDYNLDDIISNNVYSVFHLEFKLISGSPREITFTVGNRDNCSIKYARHNGDKVNLDVIYNFINTQSKDIPLQISFVLDPEDVYSSFKQQETFYTGSSMIEFNNVKIGFEILNYKDSSYIYNCTDTYKEYNYPTSYVHPTHSLYITSGLAIKDDVVLDIKGYNKNEVPCLILDLNDSKSWIKNNPFVHQDFIYDDRQQTGYVYNDPNRVLSLSNGEINNENNLLDFKYTDDYILNPCDDYELTDHDYNLDFDLDDNYIVRVKTQNIDSDISDIYGNVGYIVYKPTNKIIKKINLDLNRSSNTYNQKDYELSIEDIKIGLDLFTKNNISVVASAGPIKVSGSISEVNSGMTLWANVVMYYTYYKNPRPNKCYIGLVRDSDLEDKRFREDYVVLARVRFISPNTADLISYENRQQIYHIHNQSKNISYGTELSPEEKSLWINPDGSMDVPITASDAITKLIRWIPIWNNKCSHIVDSIMYNRFNLFRDNEVIIWKYDPDKEYGDLQSSGIIIDNSSNEEYKLSAWNRELNKIVVSKFSIDASPTGSNESDKFAAWNSEKNKIVVSNFGIDVSGNTDPYKIAAWNQELNKIVKTNIVFEINDIDDYEFLSIVYDDTDATFKIKNKKINGGDGQILFYKNGSNLNIQCDWIMNNGCVDTEVNDYIYVCNTQKDLDECKGKCVDTFEHMYSNWIKVGYTCWNGWQGKEFKNPDGSIYDHAPYQYGVTTYPTGKPTSKAAIYGADAWFYDESLKSVVQPCNTYDFTGFVSQKTYNDYDITIRCYQPQTDITHDGITYQADGSDNDMMSLIAAFTIDSNGYQHIISFDRIGGDSGYWKCTIDRSNFYHANCNSMRVLCGNDSSVSSEGGSVWRSCGDGAIIRVKREGNKFTAWTSKRVKDGIYGKDGCCIQLESSKITLDLSGDQFTIQKGTQTPIKITDEMSIKILSMFKNKKVSWGYAACSECLSTFGNIQIPGYNRKIIDLVNNKVLKFDCTTETWTETTQTVYDAFGAGKFSYNSITNKLFWNKQTEIVEILDRAYNKTDGDEGEVLYCDGNQDVNPHQIMDSYSDYESHDKYSIVTNEDQLNYCKESNINFIDVFNKWYKFGHKGGTQYGLTKFYPISYGVTKDYDVMDGSTPKHYAVKHWFYNDKASTLDTEWKAGAVPITAKTLVMPLNSDEYTGFVSNKKYSDYDICMRFYSSGTDDDYSGIVAAFAKDSDGIEHTISFLRSPNISNYVDTSNKITSRLISHWDCILDHRAYWENQTNNEYSYTIVDTEGNPTSKSITQVYLIGNEENFKDEVSNDQLLDSHPLKDKCRGNETRTTCGWNSQGGNNGGTLVRVVRKGNKFTATTTKFIQNATLSDIKESNLKYEIVLDLDNYTIQTYNDGILESKDISKYKDVLDLFKDKASFGISTMSQPAAEFELKKFITFDKIILDFHNNKTLTYDGNNWIEVDDHPISRVKAGTLYYNDIIKSKYWVDKDKNVSCVDGLISADGNDYKLNISQTNTTGKVAVWDGNNKQLQSSNVNINSISTGIIVTLPDYSKCQNITQNTTVTIDPTIYPNGAWLNYQCNKKTTSSTVNRTIKIGSYFIVQQMSNSYTEVHGPTGNSGMIPLAPNDTFIISNFNFTGNDKDIIQIFGMK